MVMTDEYELTSSAPFVVQPGKEVRVDLRLRRVPAGPGTIVLGAVSSRGSPLGGATVKFLDLDHNPVGHARTARDGRYVTYDLEPGRYLGMAGAPGHVPASPVEFDLVKGRTVALDFDLQVEAPDRGSLYGSTADHSGQPVGGVSVTLFDRGTGREVARTLTDSDGQYLFPGIPAGVYSLAAFKSGYEELPSAAIVVSAREITRYDIVMTPEPHVSQGTVSGRVLPADGRGTGAVSVALYRIEGDREHLVDVTSATPDGAYLFTDVDPGRYRAKAKGVTIAEHTVPGR